MPTGMVNTYYTAENQPRVKTLSSEVLPVRGREKPLHCAHHRQSVTGVRTCRAISADDNLALYLEHAVDEHPTVDPNRKNKAHLPVDFGQRFVSQRFRTLACWCRSGKGKDGGY